MVDASEGAEGYMILTRRVAAVHVTIDLYPDHVFLEHGFYTRVPFCIIRSWSMQFLCISMFSPPSLFLTVSCFLPMENLSKPVTELSSSFISCSLT